MSLLVPFSLSLFHLLDPDINVVLVTYVFLNSYVLGPARIATLSQLLTMPLESARYICLQSLSSDWTMQLNIKRSHDFRVKIRIQSWPPKDKKKHAPMYPLSVLGSCMHPNAKGRRPFRSVYRGLVYVSRLAMSR